MRLFCAIRDKWILPKILISCLIVAVLPHFLRQIIPNYNGENVYFPILEVNEEETNNQKRLQIAEEILKNFDWKIIQRNNWSNVAITIVASNRPGKYLTQSMAFLLDQIKNLDLIPQISICNVEPTKYPELDLFHNKIPTYSVNNLKDLAQFNLTETEGRIQKEASDYWNCLRIATSTKKEFSLLLEDDAVIVPNFFTLLDSMTKQLKSNDYSKIDYVKLYHPWPLRKIPFVFQAYSLSFLLSSFIVYFFFKRVWIFLIIVLTFIMYANLRTENYEIFSDLRFHISSNAYITHPESCCTPAVLFRTTSAIQMANELSEIKIGIFHAKDHVLDESSFIGKGTDFNYVVHIGHFSSLRRTTIHLDPLRKNHAKHS